MVAVHNHPAAGPDSAIDLARSLDSRDSLFLENENSRGALIDPEGREFIEPLKQKTILAQEEIRREAAEILQLLNTPKTTVTLKAWLWSLFGCSLVVLCGILPAFLLPANSNEYLRTEGFFAEGRRNLSLLLSFAVGSLLGDVFLHLLPEAWNSYNVDIQHIGLSTLGGLLICFFVEKLYNTTGDSQHKICAIMNLAANLVDNFTHGLAVGASFLVSPKFGMMTTFAILVHEIPHEISDFAILLRADFDRIQAVKAQLFTACGGIAGACVALWLQNDSMQSVDWILPFTAGGFINISLTQILPELNQETNRRQNIKQMIMISLGFLVMASVSQFHIA
ncbi:metal cation transporter, ZIP family [Dictyocaulus viviparus]|uniref:Metal cation transporter, ZIP family n=1 Tax=Dictyocaulus viviparus TaxID=29172 RepID=A0A0D8X9I4_DICVI|nr:metal cation transporter, ZIP family [Dictyocaulus viviparus]